MKTIVFNLSDLPGRSLVKIAFLLSASLVTFILLFQPYEYNRLSFGLSVELISLVFICTFLVSVTFLLTLRTKLFANVRSMLLIWLFYTFVISQAIYSYTIIKGFNDFTWNGMGVYFITSFLLSMVPLLVLYIFRKSPIIQPSDEQLKLNYQTFQKNKVLLFKAEDNYVRVTYLDEQNEPTHTLVRNTMKEVMRRAGNQFFLRVHRSYAINLNHLAHHSGNSKGYFAHLKHLEQKIPVSRSNGKKFRKRISSIRH